MKFTEETYNLISEILEQEYNSCDDKERQKEIKIALEELDSIGTQ